MSLGRRVRHARNARNSIAITLHSRILPGFAHPQPPSLLTSQRKMLHKYRTITGHGPRKGLHLPAKTITPRNFCYRTAVNQVLPARSILVFCRSNSASDSWGSRTGLGTQCFSSVLLISLELFDTPSLQASNASPPWDRCTFL